MTAIAPSPWVGRARIVPLALAHAFGTLNFMAILAMAPAVQAALGLSRTEFGLLTSAYSAGLLGCALPFGWLVDRIGVRAALVISHLIMASATLLFTQARSLSVAAICVGLCGVGYAFINPATAKAVLLLFPVRERGTAMGIKQTGVPIGGAAAAGLGALGASLGWQPILWIVAGLTLGGSGLYLSLDGNRSDRQGGAVRDALADFREVVGNRDLTLLNCTGAVFSAAQGAIFTYLTLFMRDVTHVGLPFASLCLGLAHAGSACGRIAWGLVSDRLLGGRRKLGMVLIGACASTLLVCLLAVGSGWRVGLGALLAFLLGLTIASYAGLLQSASVEAVEVRLAGAAIGYHMILTPLGSMLGPPGFGAVVDRSGSYGAGWLLVAGLLLGSTLIFAARFREGLRKGVA